MFVDNTLAQYAAATSVSLSRPIAKAYNTLYAVISVNTTGLGSAAQVITAPVGWALVKRTNVNNKLILVTYYHVAQDGDPLSWTWTVAVAAVPMSGIMACYSDITGIDVFDDASAVAASSVAAPSVAPAENDTMLLTIYGSTSQPTTAIALDSRLKLRAQTGLGMMLALADQVRGPDEATGTRTATVNVAGDLAAQTHALIQVNVPVAFKDNYKSKVMRRLLPSPYDNRLKAVLGKVLTIVGTGDNDIGGEFGSSDFLPDETP